MTHRSLQTAVIEEEVAQELVSIHDASVCGRSDHLQSSASVAPASGHMSRQNLLEHFVDNLINEAAQQSKMEIEEFLAQSSAPEPLGSNGSSSLVELMSECLPQLDQYATNLADDIITSALDDVVVKERQRRRLSDFIRPSRHPGQTAEPQRQHGRRFERQQTVSGFRDTLLSDFDNKLMSSNVAADTPVVTFADTGSKKRRSSEPANLNYSKNSRVYRAASALPSSSSSSAAAAVDHRKVITSWFASPGASAEHCVADGLSDYVQNLVVDAFMESLSSSKPVRRRRRKSSSKCPVSDAIMSYADHLTSCILQAAQHELRTCHVFSTSSPQTCLQSVAENFARSIVDDALALQSLSSQRPLVSYIAMWTDKACCMDVCTGWRKKRASVSHCNYSENSTTELRGKW